MAIYGSYEISRRSHANAPVRLHNSITFINASNIICFPLLINVPIKINDIIIKGYGYTVLRVRKTALSLKKGTAPEYLCHNATQARRVQIVPAAGDESTASLYISPVSTISFVVRFYIIHKQLILLLPFSLQYTIGILQSRIIQPSGA
jgi:hypothetical protein